MRRTASGASSTVLNVYAGATSTPATASLSGNGVASPGTTYTVTYDGNGSTGGAAPADTTLYTQGQTVTVLGNTGGLVKAGFQFTGWNTDADGSGTAYSPASTFAMGTANVTLYAQWSAGPDVHRDL